MTDIHSQEQTYWSRDVVKTLEIGDSTLRKWCRLLESAGYRFLKDEQDRRAFTEHDIIMFRHFRELTQDGRVSLDTASDVVVSKFKPTDREAVHSIALPDTGSQDSALSRYDERFEAVLEKVSSLEEQNERLIEMNRTMAEYIQRQDAFQKALLDRLDGQERALQEMMQTNMLIASTKPQEGISDSQKRITDMITQKRVESKLEKEALALWEQKPESERIRKVGLFRKEEDWVKRDRFIKDYISERFADRLKAEYEI